MSLYTCRSIPEGHRLVKWDDDLNIVAIYEIGRSLCTCPQGYKGLSCRHLRDILPEFKRLGRADSGMFYDYDEDLWFKGLEH